MSKTDSKYGDWALITGGSAGIGLAFAHELAAKGQNLILVARGQKALDASADELIAKHGVEVQTVAIDISAPDGPRELYEQTRGRQPGLVIFSAGMETTGHYTKVSAEAHRNLIDVNVQAPAELARLYGGELCRLQSLYTGAGRGASRGDETAWRGRSGRVTGPDRYGDARQDAGRFPQDADHSAQTSESRAGWIESAGS